MNPGRHHHPKPNTGTRTMDDEKGRRTEARIGTGQGRKERRENSPQDYRRLRRPAGNKHSEEQRNHSPEIGNFQYNFTSNNMNTKSILYCDNNYIYHAKMNVP